MEHPDKIVALWKIPFIWKVLTAWWYQISADQLSQNFNIIQSEVLL